MGLQIDGNGVETAPVHLAKMGSLLRRISTDLWPTPACQHSDSNTVELVVDTVVQTFT